jgi:P-type E1-E2 ATPase
VALRVDIPGRAALELEFLLLDVNGTLTDRGALVDGVTTRLSDLRGSLDVQLLSADTFGTLAPVARELGVEARTVVDGEDKLRTVEALGAGRCVAVGNGANDAAMLARAALGIAVVGPEGASAAALAAADVVCRSIVEALDLLLDPRLVRATLRA